MLRFVVLCFVLFLFQLAYSYYLRGRPIIAEGGLYDVLPVTLRHVLITHKYSRELQAIHVLRTSDQFFAAQLIIHSKPYEATPGEIIYDMRDVAYEMTFILRGSVRIIIDNGFRDVLAGYSTGGGYFGDFEFYKKSVRTARYEAAQSCTLLAIDYKHFLKAIEDHPIAGKRFMSRLKSRYDLFQTVRNASSVSSPHTSKAGMKINASEFNIGNFTRNIFSSIRNRVKVIHYEVVKSKEDSEDIGVKRKLVHDFNDLVAHQKEQGFGKIENTASLSLKLEQIREEHEHEHEHNGNEYKGGIEISEKGMKKKIYDEDVERTKEEEEKMKDTDIIPISTSELGLTADQRQGFPAILTSIKSYISPSNTLLSPDINSEAPSVSPSQTPSQSSSRPSSLFTSHDFLSSPLSSTKAFFYSTSPISNLQTTNKSHSTCEPSSSHLYQLPTSSPLSQSSPNSSFNGSMKRVGSSTFSARNQVHSLEDNIPLNYGPRLWADGELEVLNVMSDSCGIDSNYSIFQITKELTYRIVKLDKHGNAMYSDETIKMIRKLNLFHPEDKIKIRWDMIMGILIVYSVLTIPLQLAFTSYSVGMTGDSLGYFDFAVDGMFFLDIILAFNTSYYSIDEEAFITVRSRISERYVQSWFLVDLMSSLPFDVFVSLSQPSHVTNLTIIRLVKIVRLIRIFKLAKKIDISNILNGLEDYLHIKPTVLSLIITVLQVIIISHTICCFWWGLCILLSSEAWIDQVGHIT